MRWLAMIACVAVVAWAQEPVLFGPYIQNVQTEQATVMWVTGGASVTLTGGDAPETREEYRTHRVRFDHLAPDTEYQYALENGVQGVFRTAPEGGANFRFAAYGDTRTNEDIHQAVIEGIRKQENLSFVINTGDLVSRGSVLEHWKSFFRAAEPLMRETYYVPCLGNHEDNAAEYFDFFDLPGNEERFSFNWGNVHFVALNTEAPDVPDGIDDSAESSLWNTKIMWDYFAEQRAWLDEDLRHNYGADFLVVFFHVPMYDTKLSRREPQIEVRKAFDDIIEKHRVELVLTGHTHNYQHHVKDGTHYLVTGGGGAPLYDIEDSVGVDAPGVETVKQEKVHHFCVVDVENGRMHVDAIRVDGSKIEEFSLESRAGSRLVERRLDAIGGLPWEAPAAK